MSYVILPDGSRQILRFLFTGDLIAALLARDQIERVALTDRLAGLGQASAKARICALLLCLRDRMRRLDPAVEATVSHGLTQERIGDATGLASVHVNRMLRQLEEGLVARDGGRMTLLNEAAPARTARYVDRSRDTDLGWLPPAR